MRKSLLVVLLSLGACGGPPPPTRTPQQRADDSAPAVKALQASEFVGARNAADAALARDPRNARAAAVRAIARYQDAGSTLFKDLRLLLEGGGYLKAIDHEEGRAMWQRFADALGEVDADLAVAAADPEVSLELCLACWEHDWNQNGRLDDGDRKLFEIEYDPDPPCKRAPPAAAPAPADPEAEPPQPEAACSDELPEHDPRRRPTFRFDRGDVDWARAMVAFQRAGVELVLAYRWNELDKLFGSFLAKNPPVVAIHLADAKRVRRARELIRAGLDFAARTRTEYLAETDDDREWVPNPRQQHHPIPMPMDEAVYDTWAGVVGDLAALLDSTQGLPLRKIVGAIDRKATLLVPDAWIDLGAMLREPKDLVIDLGAVTKLDDHDSDPAATRAQTERLLKGLLGNGYRTAPMQESPLLERLEKMKQSLDHDPNESFERKLRYFLWLN